MMIFRRGIWPAIAAFALYFAGAAVAQESLDAGKTGAQLYASNCAVCHKSPQGLSRRGGFLGLSSFLTEHYTSSHETAKTIAAYVESADHAPAAAKRTGAAPRTAKDDQKANHEKSKRGAAKQAGKPTKPGRAKTAKPAEPKAGEAKPASSSASDKSAEPKPTESKATEPKPAESRASEPKPEAAPIAKPEETKKSD
jgi:mono/diheme cytochrome c family protein